MSVGRPIDHIVLPCRDLADAARWFERLGFQVGRRNRHPWGTENHIVQFPGAFLELIALAPDVEPPPPTDDAFPFAGFLAGKAASRNPNAMVVLRSDDASGDVEAFARSGIGSRRRLDFSRDATTATGQVKTVAFSLAFAEAPLMPDLGFFVCQQHRPENLWGTSAQRHPNGVRSLAGLVIVADRPGDHARFLQAFSGAQPTATQPDALAFQTGDDLLEVITAGAFEARFGVAPPGVVDGIGHPPVLAAIRLAAAEPSSLGRRIKSAGYRAVAVGPGWAAAGDESFSPLLVFGQA